MNSFYFPPTTTFYFLETLPNTTWSRIEQIDKSITIDFSEERKKMMKKVLSIKNVSNNRSKLYPFSLEFVMKNYLKNRGLKFNSSVRGPHFKENDTFASCEMSVWYPCFNDVTYLENVLEPTFTIELSAKDWQTFEMWCKNLSFIWFRT